MCGLEIEVVDGSVRRIRADRDDVWSKGYLCPKGTTLGHVHDDPDRLRAPLVRDGSDWREVGWDEAFARTEELLRPVLDGHGIDSLACYIGNPTAHNFSLSRYAGAFVPMSGITQLYSAGTVDQWPKNVVGACLYGGMWTIPVPDLDRTDFLLMLGANPPASQGSLLAAPDVLGRLDAIRERGGTVVVVDPRRTKTAEQADEWVPIRPGTDAALLFAMVQVLFRRAWSTSARRPGRGGRRGARAVRRSRPEAVADACLVPAETIRRSRTAWCRRPAGAVYGRIGTCNQEFGTLASWLVEVLNIVTGNLDRAGGSMFSKPVAWSIASLPMPDFADGFTFGRWSSRVRGRPRSSARSRPVPRRGDRHAGRGAGPGARHHRRQPGDLVAGRRTPGRRARRARRDDLDRQLAERDHAPRRRDPAGPVLPRAAPLRRADLELGGRNAANFSEPVFPPHPDRPAEWEILLRLAAIVGGTPATTVDVEGVRRRLFRAWSWRPPRSPARRIADRDPAEILAATPGNGPVRILDFSLRIGPWGEGYGADPEGLTLDRLRESPHGLDFGPLEPRLDEMLRTPSGRIELAHPYITADVPRLRARLERTDGDSLVLVSRRHLRSNNSWMHNVEVLVKGKDRCTLLVNPDDAGRLGLEDGGDARCHPRRARWWPPWR